MLLGGFQQPMDPSYEPEKTCSENSPVDVSTRTASK